MSDEELFEQILDGISNDRFLAFVEQYTHALISPLSPKFLPWCAEALSVDGARSAVPFAGPSSTDGKAEAVTTLVPGNNALHVPFGAFSVAHYREFQTYASLFESRILSVLRRHPSRLSPEDFYRLCAAHAQLGSLALDDSRGTTSVGGGTGPREEHGGNAETTLNGAAASGDPRTAPQTNSDGVTADEMCATILDMVVTVSSFESFAEMLAERQRCLMLSDDASGGSGVSIDSGDDES